MANPIPGECPCGVVFVHIQLLEPCRLWSQLEVLSSVPQHLTHPPTHPPIGSYTYSCLTAPSYDYKPPTPIHHIHPPHPPKCAVMPHGAIVDYEPCTLLTLPPGDTLLEVFQRQGGYSVPEQLLRDLEGEAPEARRARWAHLLPALLQRQPPWLV